MARIPEEEIERIKSETDLAALVRSRGVVLRKHGYRDLVGLCPFHEDRANPNFIVSPAKGLFHCMGCGAAGNAIQFVERHDGLSFRHAYELLAEGKAAFEPPRGRPGRSTAPKLPCPLDEGADDEALLDQVVSYYEERLWGSDAALAYLASRGLDDEGLLGRFRVGYADRSLGLRLPNKKRLAGARLRGRLEELGVYRRESGHEHFNGSVVVPVFDAGGHVAEMYGRKISKGLRKGTPLHLYLPGPHRGIFNPEALEEREIILCESIIDALTFVRHGMGAATCIFGTEGFTEELFEAIKDRGVESVRLAYDADEAGRRATARDAGRLGAIGVECHEVRFPEGFDANDFARRQGGEALRGAVRSALWLGAGPPSRAPSSKKEIAAELAAEAPAPPAAVPPPVAANAAAPEPPPLAAGGALVANEEAAKEKSSRPPAGGNRERKRPELVRTGEHHELQIGPRVYRVGGLEKNGSLEVMKLTLRLWYDDRFHVDQLDLYHDTHRRRFVERAAEECRLEPELVKRDLAKLLLACEGAQERRLYEALEPGEEAPDMSPEEQREARAFLEAPDLIGRLGEAFEAAGTVGEKTNKIAAYLACTSRLLSKPLAIIIQSTSAAGKSTLMDAVLSFFPPEEQIKYSAMTGQSLYYLGDADLKHKVLAIVEEEGAEKASYALKLLQSEGELTIASTGKDPHTGRMETQEYHVEGPVAIVFTTTSIDIDEELRNRCLILTVDESRAQTERIHALQRQARTLEGLRLKKRRERVLTLLQNAQRLLGPMAVVNPYADALTFTAACTRTRRDHEKYLTLIESVTLLHQRQRPVEEDEVAGPHIKTTLADIEAANAIAPEVLGRSLDELPPQTRGLLEAIKAHVREQMAAKGAEREGCPFTRRQMRERTGWSATQIRVHLQRLVDYEYLAVRHGGNGSSFVYELLVGPEATAGVPAVGLIDPAKLKLRRRPDGGEGLPDGG